MVDMSVMPKSEKLSYLLLGLILIMLASFAAPWVKFPLSAGITGIDYIFILESEVQYLYFYIALVLLGLSAFIYSEYRQAPRYNVFFIAISLSLLLLVPAYLMSRDSSVVSNYIQDTEDFRQLQRFFRTYFVPNKGNSLVLLQDGAFNNITARVISVFSILNWGWFVAVFSALSIFIISIYRTKLLVLILSVFIVFSPAGIMLGNTGLAALYYVKAKKNFADADVMRAYTEMISAFRLDPLLKYSERSTYLFSSLSFQIYGEDNASGVLYRAKQLELAGKRKQSMQLLLETVKYGDGGDEYFSFVERQARVQLVFLVEKISRRYYREGFYDPAFAIISDALSVMPGNKALRMQRTYAYIQLNLADRCLQTVKEVLQEIDTVYLKADFLSTLGECYLLDNQLINARLAFQQSMELDGTRNIRAIRGLSGT